MSADICKTCKGTRMIDDGQMHCSSGGIPFENGPINCVKDCPDCNAPNAPGSTLKVMRGQDDEDNPIAYMRNEGSPNNLVKCTFACPGAFGVYASRGF